MEKIYIPQYAAQALLFCLEVMLLVLLPLFVVCTVIVLLREIWKK